MFQFFSLSVIPPSNNWSREVVARYSSKYALLKVFQYSQKNTCAGVCSKKSYSSSDQLVEN